MHTDDGDSDGNTAARDWRYQGRRRDGCSLCRAYGADVPGTARPYVAAILRRP
jgi:hypothetical protein